MNTIATSAVLLLTLIGSTWSYPQDYFMDGPVDYEYDDNNAEEEVFNVDYDKLSVPKFIVGKQVYTIKEGEDVNISFAVSEATPYVSIIKKLGAQGKQEQILFAGEVEVKASNKNKYELNNGVLTIRNVNRDEAGEYMCYFEMDPVVELTHTLDVQYAPTISSPTPKKQKVNKGDSFTMECEAEGNPMPKILWSQNGGHLPAGSEVEEGRSMTILQVDRHVAGTYTCKADNGIGEPATEDMTLVVEYAPEIVTEKVIIRTGEDDKVELVCIVYSHPAAEVTWQKDGSSVDHEPHMVETQGGHRHTITIEKITEEMFGDYTCHAKNNKGKAESTIDLTEKPQNLASTSGSSTLIGTSTSLLVIVAAFVLKR